MGDGGADLKEPEVAAGAEVLRTGSFWDVRLFQPERNETWFTSQHCVYGIS